MCQKETKPKITVTSSPSPRMKQYMQFFNDLRHSKLGHASSKESRIIFMLETIFTLNEFPLQ